MNLVRSKLKYYIYGLIIGVIVLGILHSFCFSICLLDTHNLLGISIVTEWSVLIGIGIGNFVHSCQMIKKWRYMEKEEYCLIWGAAFVISIMIYGMFLLSLMQNVLVSIPENIFIAALGIIPISLFVCSFDFLSANTNIDLNTKNKYLIDQEIETPEEDCFFKEQVDRFVEDMKRYSGNYVLGIEGPWGIGKTSFANLCCKRLKDDNECNFLIYKFNPLNYENSDKVLKNFYMGLISTITEKHFEPEIEALLESYMEKVFTAVSEQTFNKVKMKFYVTKKTEEQIILRLGELLGQLKYKIIVVVDDLDRLDFVTIKKSYF